MTHQIMGLVQTRGLRWLRMDGAPPPGFTTWLPADCRLTGVQLVSQAATMPLADYDIYLCGPPPWMAKVEADLRAAGAEPRLIHSESFSM